MSNEFVTKEYSTKEYVGKDPSPPISRKQLECAYRMFKKLLELSNDGFIAIDKSNKIIEINKSYCDWLGITYEEALTKRIEELTPNTKLPLIRDQGGTEQNVLHYLQHGHRKGSIVAVSRSALQINGENIAAIGQICYPKTTAKVAELIKHAYKELEFYKAEYKQRVQGHYSFNTISGEAPQFTLVKQQAQKAAPMNLSVLLTGETGTGKEVFAHAIHNASPRAHHPFICVNCSAIPSELMESELFGYEDGAFTGASKKGKIGKIEMANKGTLFLDEIGDMPLHMQVKILRLLQEKELERLGSNQKRKIDIRIIAATNANLEQKIREKTFRSDLFFRLSVVNLVLPPLRERIDDIPLLAQCFLDSLNLQFGEEKQLSEKAKAALRAYNWPGNARELRNAMELAFGFADQTILEPKDFPKQISQKNIIDVALSECAEGSLAEVMKRIEQEVLVRALTKHNNNYAKAAKMLGLHRATLYKKMKKS